MRTLQSYSAISYMQLLVIRILNVISKGTHSSSCGFCFTWYKDWQRGDEKFWIDYQWRGEFFYIVILKKFNCALLNKSTFPTYWSCFAVDKGVMKFHHRHPTWFPNCQTRNKEALKSFKGRTKFAEILEQASNETTFSLIHLAGQYDTGSGIAIIGLFSFHECTGTLI